MKSVWRIHVRGWLCISITFGARMVRTSAPEVTMVQPDAASGLPAPICYACQGDSLEEGRDAHSLQEGECTRQDERAALDDQFFKAYYLCLTRVFEHERRAL